MGRLPGMTAIVVALMLAGCAPTAPAASPSPIMTAAPTPIPTPTPEVHDVTGTLDIWAYHKGSETDCKNADGYSNVPAGSDVILKDEAGTILGKGTLVQRPNGLKGYCGYSFEVGAVPLAKFYAISIGSRDGPTRSYSEMTAASWDYQLTLAAYK